MIHQSSLFTVIQAAPPLLWVALYQSITKRWTCTRFRKIKDVQTRSKISANLCVLETDPLREPNRLRVPGLNPYEFDPNSPDMGRTYQTSFSDLSNMNRDLPNSRSAQMLSAYSATMDSLFNPRPHEEFGVSAENSASELQHSHSSPEFTPDPFFAGLQKTGANLTTSSQYHAVTIPSRIPSRYGDEQTKRMSRCGHRDTGDEASSHSRAEPPFPTQHFTSFASPSFPTYQPCKAYSQHTPSTFSDNRRSITKELEEVVEHDGSASPTEFSPILGSPEPPLRRSRSPMKKNVWRTRMARIFS